MLSRRSRRLIAVAHFIGCLGLVPAFALVVWSIGDGTQALSQLGIATALPAITFSNAGIVPLVLGIGIGALQILQLTDEMRARAIAGDMDAIAPAKPLTPASATPVPLPITLVWGRGQRGRIGLTIAFIATLAAYFGLGGLLASAGMFTYLFSLQGISFWELLGAVALCALVLGLIPLAFLYAATRGKSGIVADAFGVSAWRARRASYKIAWTDARLLEVLGGRHGSGVSYTLYASDGRLLRWTSRSDDPRYMSSHMGTAGAENSSEQRMSAVLNLIATHAGLTPRTFDGATVDRSSNLAAPGNLLLSKEATASFGGGGLTLLLGITAGCGLVTLAYRSPLTPTASLVCVTALGLSALWSLLATIRQALTTPRRLRPEERPRWRIPQASLNAQPMLLRQARIRLRNWSLATRAALLLVGGAAGMATIISALLSGSGAGNPFLTWPCVAWLALTLLFACLRLHGQLSRDRVELLANAQGLQNLRAPNERPTPWTNITSLRFTWSRANGILYTALTAQGDEFTWAGQSRLWRDELSEGSIGPDAAAGIDGDTFAAIVAARTGLTPAQELIS